MLLRVLLQLLLEFRRKHVLPTHLAALSLQHYLQKPLHGLDVDSEEFEFASEHLENVAEHLAELCLALGDKVTTLFYVLPD